ncbi:FadR/GntR family transcriptional regulator [Microbacterium radiodurans]|uniref:FadR family transcriptional regulator n=1 Tax=Microbacterium radiodurans TaxID=661398 RepID=A0A5J5ITW0_9MICO|nr:FCD domain-containing protein [Microbacterium radiodurans]KAA9089584.1 FadR family transcriptional regulator [Microbacterium radiodurans]
MPAYRDTGAPDLTAALTSLPARTPVSEVARRLMDLFTSGDVAPGTRLPPERQLAATLGVGRSAVREALAALEILGIVDVRPGSGTYLRGAASELLPQTLRWGLLIGERNTRELIELRSGLEIYVARLAAGAAAGDGGTLGRFVDRMRDALDDLPAFARADLAFHHELARLAGNAMLVDLLHVVRSLLQVYADRAVHDAEQASRALAEHEAIARAVAAGDADAAASAMAGHMATAAQRITADHAL